MSTLQELGIGIIYFPGLESLIESHFDVIQTIEIEPQTLWYKDSSECDSFRLASDRIDFLRSFPCPKLFHGVGFPVGGSLLPGNGHFSTLNEHIVSLRPAWVSEHLSFNTFEYNDAIKQVTFLLPPVQTPDGVETAVQAVRHYRSRIELPFAFETGINYLQPKPYEMDDGDFIASVAEGADCHILLDVHNILANQKNGRQSVKNFVAQLPLERVCEIHIAGGLVRNGYYLDAHSGLASDELFQVLEGVVRQTPNLKAIIFEMMPDYAGQVSNEEIRRQFEKMQRVWDRRGKGPGIRKAPKPKNSCCDTSAPGVSEWERTLGQLALAKPIEASQLKEELECDDGLKIIQELVFHFRASMVVGSLTLSTRLLQLTWGEDAFNTHLSNFLHRSDAQMFEPLAAEQYARGLINENHQIPFLYKILEFETVAAKTQMDGIVRKVEFDFDPLPVLLKLSDYKMPEPQRKSVNFLMHITPDEPNQQSGIGTIIE